MSQWPAALPWLGVWRSSRLWEWRGRRALWRFVIFPIFSCPVCAVLINPRRACVVRVTAVGLSVCVSVSEHLTSGVLFILKTLSHTRRVTKVKIFVGINMPLLAGGMALRGCAERAKGLHFSVFHLFLHLLYFSHDLYGWLTLCSASLVIRTPADKQHIFQFG